MKNALTIPPSFRAALTASCLVVGLTGPAFADFDPGTVTVDLVADGFTAPWSVERLPDGGVLVTEIAGQLWHLTPEGDRVSVSGVPEVWAQGQGGLLDLMVPRDFETSRELFFTFSHPQRGGAGTALARAVLSEDGASLSDVAVLFEMESGGNRGQHFGSRVVEGAEGHLFITTGDRGVGEDAQDLSRHNGKVIRINRDGSVPADNPFVDQAGAKPEIWTYGHRNPQGSSLDASGQLWTVEHGARGGDEINESAPGTNFGWPVISYGVNYNGSRIGEGQEKEGMAQPAFYWDPSIAPSGYAIPVEGPWAGLHFIGSLKFDALSVLNPDGWDEQRLSIPETARVRDVIPGPDGSIWFLSEDRGAVYELRAAE